MGIIKAVTTAIGGSLADQWLEVIESGNMGDQTVFTSGVKIRKGPIRRERIIRFPTVPSSTCTPTSS